MKKAANIIFLTLAFFAATCWGQVPYTTGLGQQIISGNNWMQFEASVNWTNEAAMLNELGGATNGDGFFWYQAATNASDPAGAALASTNAGNIVFQGGGFIMANNIHATNGISATSLFATNIISLTGGTFTGNGAGLTNVTAANVSGVLTNSLSGPNVSVTMGAGSLSGQSINVSSVTAANTYGGNVSGNGAGLTSLPAEQLVYGGILPFYNSTANAIYFPPVGGVSLQIQENSATTNASPWVPTAGLASNVISSAALSLTNALNSVYGSFTGSGFFNTNLFATAITFTTNASVITCITASGIITYPVLPGTNDNTAAFNAAVNGGGHVKFPINGWTVTNVIVNSTSPPVDIDGTGCTLIMPTNGIAAGYIFNSRNNHNVSVTGLTVDGQLRQTPGWMFNNGGGGISSGPQPWWGDYSCITTPVSGGQTSAPTNARSGFCLNVQGANVFNSLHAVGCSVAGFLLVDTNGQNSYQKTKTALAESTASYCYIGLATPHSSGLAVTDFTTNNVYIQFFTNNGTVGQWGSVDYEQVIGFSSDNCTWGEWNESWNCEYTALCNQYDCIGYGSSEPCHNTITGLFNGHNLFYPAVGAFFSGCATGCTIDNMVGGGFQTELWIQNSGEISINGGRFSDTGSTNALILATNLIGIVQINNLVTNFAGNTNPIILDNTSSNFVMNGCQPSQGIGAGATEMQQVTATPVYNNAVATNLVVPLGNWVSGNGNASYTNFQSVPGWSVIGNNDKQVSIPVPAYVTSATVALTFASQTGFGPYTYTNQITPQWAGTNGSGNNPTIVTTVALGSSAVFVQSLTNVFAWPDFGATNNGVKCLNLEFPTPTNTTRGGLIYKAQFNVLGVSTNLLNQ